MNHHTGKSVAGYSYNLEMTGVQPSIAVQVSPLKFFMEYITGMPAEQAAPEEIVKHPHSTITAIDIRGWAFIEESSDDRSLYLALWDEESNRFESIHTLYNRVRVDVNQAFPQACEMTGFKQTINFEEAFKEKSGRFRLALVAHASHSDFIGGVLLDWCMLFKSGVISYIGEEQPLSTNQAHFERILHNKAKTHWQPKWALFDKEWYLATYPLINERMDLLDIEDVEEFYREVGSGLGHSPNPYFDEEWYLKTYPAVYDDVLKGKYRSGFVHYCNEGVDLKLNPHWLYSEQYYLDNNQDLTTNFLAEHGLVNGYDHYLFLGDEQLRNGHYLFDAHFAQMALAKAGYTHTHWGPYSLYLYIPPENTSLISLSMGFDIEWYSKTYPEVVQLIKEKAGYHSFLHHYLSNETPTSFNPLPDFSEEYYVTRYPDIAHSISIRHFRNGYEHFMRFGANELRSPSEEIDLKAYYESSVEVRKNIEAHKFVNLFMCWVWEKAKGTSSHENRTLPPEEQTKELFRHQARQLLPGARRQKIDFSYEGKPDLSVIIVGYNQFDYTLQCLASLRDNYKGNIDLIFVDSGSGDETIYIKDYVQGITLLRTNTNTGFLVGCNIALQYVQSDALLYLNNDVILHHGAVSNALKRLSSDPQIAAVGSKVIRTNGMLQEAGSIVWRDGTTSGYMRDQDPIIPEANFVRDVDFCSGVFLMTKAHIIHDMGGFNPIFRPAYFEETDLCIRLLEKGYRIVYDPTVVITHLEYGSFGTENSHQLMEQQHQVFTKLHAHFLAQQNPFHAANAIFASSRSRNKGRILFFEDRIPFKRLGSGYGRSYDIVCSLVKLGYQVTVFPVNPHDISIAEAYGTFPDTVEVLVNKNITNLEVFLSERTGYFDVIWVGRIHNLDRMIGIFEAAHRFIPADRLILDTEAVTAPRTLEKEILDGKENILSMNEQEKQDHLVRKLKIELKHGRACREIIAVNERDAQFVRQAGFSDVSQLGHMMNVPVTEAGYEQRQHILFIGAIHEMDSPNMDSLRWFVQQVMPHLDNLLGERYEFHIGGYIAPKINMDELIQHKKVRLLGPLKDLYKSYNIHRVFVAPTRFAGGIPFKVHEAASYGIPLVITDILNRQLGWKDEDDVLVAPAHDAEQFARQIAKAYNHADVWERLRNNALAKVQKECSPEVFMSNLRHIVEKVYTSST